MDINLDGGEITIIKALGTGGSEIDGATLLTRVAPMGPAEVIDALNGLVMLGYVSADNTSFHAVEVMKQMKFRVNSGYSKDLKEALDPQPQKGKSKRVRRE